MKSFAFLLILLVAVSCVSSRWLPTRSNSDKLEQLRELLRELQEQEHERSSEYRPFVYKREVGPSLNAPSLSEGDPILMQKKH